MNSHTILSKVDKRMAKEIKEKYSRNGKYLLMGFFGLIGRVKTLDKILEAMRDLKFNNSLKTRFLVLGKVVDIKYLKYLNKLVTEYGLNDYVDFVGFLEPDVLDATISSLDFMIMPFSDGYSPKNSSMVTILAQNKPVITTTRYGNKTLETHGIYYLDSHSDIKKMEEYILMFQDNQNLLSDVNYTMLDFSWKRNVNEHLSLYQKLLSQ